MLIRFRIDESGFRCVDAPVLANATEIDYIKCHFEFKSEAWKNVQAVLAIFKSATYNKTSEILLDSNGDCYIDPEVYKRGGTIQCKVFGDKYHSDSVNSSSSITEVVEFYINENLTLPTPIPSKYDAFLAEYLRAREVLENVITEVETKLENGEFDGDPGIGISSVVYNSDGTLTITLSDGSSFVSGYSMKGEQGADGVGISTVTFGQDGTVTVTLSNGTTFTSEYSFKGEQGVQGDPGADGEDGRGITSIIKTATSGLVDTYTITYTDGTTSTFTVTNGRDGSGGGTNADWNATSGPAQILNKPYNTVVSTIDCGSESFTTSVMGGMNVGTLTGVITVDTDSSPTLNITFDGVLYPNLQGNDEGIYGASVSGFSIDFTDYPFAFLPSSNTVVTEAPGEHSISVEAVNEVLNITDEFKNAVNASLASAKVINIGFVAQDAFSTLIQGAGGYPNPTTVGQTKTITYESSAASIEGYDSVSAACSALIKSIPPAFDAGDVIRFRLTDASGNPVPDYLTVTSARDNTSVSASYADYSIINDSNGTFIWTYIYTISIRSSIAKVKCAISVYKHS